MICNAGQLYKQQTYLNSTLYLSIKNEWELC